MALGASIQHVPGFLSRRASYKWGAAFGVGLAAVTWRSITGGDIRAGSTLLSLYAPHPLLNSRYLSSFPSRRSAFSAFSPNSNMPLTPPQAPPRWDHTPEEIASITADFIASDRVRLDAIAALDHKDCNFENVFQALADIETDFDTTGELMSFYKNVSPSKAVRDASNKSALQRSESTVEMSMRKDLFDAKVAAEKNLKDSGAYDKLTSEQKRLMEKMVLEGKRNGLALAENERAELVKLKKDIHKTCIEFSRNFNEEKSVISFTDEELKGVPPDVRSGFSQRTEGDKVLYDIPYKTTDILPVFKFAEDPNTRRRANEGLESRLEVNVSLLKEVLALRRRVASLLGYKNWADYVTEVKMVKSSKNVEKYLDDLETKLKPVGMKERDILLAMKEKEHKEKGLPFDGNFYVWDYRYYDRKFVENSLHLDDMEVKEYFPVSVVIPAILSIYQSLLGVRFEEIKTSTWHPEVQAFAVWDRDAKDETGFKGYCYLDLYPRESKYSHAAVWSLISGYKRPDGTRQYPLVAMVANLAKPTPEKPALMTHSDVVTFFHEIGHAFHGLLSYTTYARFHGTSVPKDFVEAPSQMLENWCWEPKVLQIMSSHYETQEHLSLELIEKVIKSRYTNFGLHYLRQIFFAKFDLKVHTDREEEDYTDVWNSMREKISFVKSGKNCPGQATFAHITGGYDAGYYGYSYSLVFAADMYTTVFKEDPLDPARGRRYREKILGPGNSRESLELLTDFLGRPPNSDAFLQEMFGTAPASRY